ncbi:Crp/Fnr family transcriptional regulator [Flavobacterium sp. NRK1]|uniref:Crp/Fnr family transcriptional regulator n=1 Tax=Flavobacterium sp. NRK1 TaxID=2954929 RepID=UPI002093670B|nr:Crp/Fnr family transcriptional regulator [Flavobacterium sp. NRK1]MCO6147777.1 Crp/Fnr family transcriptional regulator [Flavobacterium sp. NRK1]
MAKSISLIHYYLYIMEELINKLLQFGNLNQQQIDLIKSRAHAIEIKKGEYYSEAGKIAKQVGFLTEGVFRICFYGKKGEDFTRYFIVENMFVVDMDSFYNEIPSSVYVEAVTDCQIVVFEKSDFHDLANTIISWNEIFTRIATNALSYKARAGSVMLTQDASERYLAFLEQYPGLANKIPLSALASYLGITQSSLSRIRKNI